MQKSLILTFLVFALAASLIGCSRSYDLAVTVEGEGEIDPGPGIHVFARGQIIPLEAVPADGWVFAGWAGPHGTLVENGTITMDGNRCITVKFAKLSHELDISIEPEEGGRVDVVLVQGIRSIGHGERVRLTALPNPGYVFSHWDDDPEDITNPMNFTMDGPRLIQAVFVARVADPVFSAPEGSYTVPKNLEISCATPGAVIRYTTDGVSIPSPTEGVVLDATGKLQINETMVIKAIAYKEGMASSSVVTRTYTMQAHPPIFSLDSGNYEGTIKVLLGASGLTIRYTLDGTSPTPTNGLLYTGPIEINRSVWHGFNDSAVLRAVAYGANLAPSDIVWRSYRITHWPARAAMPTARKGLSAVSYGGKIYAVGGHNGTSFVNTVEAYDPLTNTWETKAPMPTARGFFAAIVRAGKIYVIGGQTDSQLAVGTVESYDLVANTWSTAHSPMPHPVSHISGVNIYGSLHIMSGGFKDGSDPGWHDGIQIYSPGLDRWDTQTTPYGETRRGYGAITPYEDHRAYFVGGISPEFLSAQKLLFYDGSKNIWSYLPNMSQQHVDFAILFRDHKLICFGGRDSWNTARDYVSVYDLLTQCWSSGQRMPHPRYGHAGVSCNLRMFIIGGADSSGNPVADVWEYKP